MDKNQLHQLIERYLKGTASETEKQKLLMWYQMKNKEETVWELEDGEKKEDVKARILQRIGEHSSLGKESFRRNYVRYAAVLLLFLSVSFGLLWSLRNHIVPDQSRIKVSQRQVENRQLLLPDSSVVILRPGSTLSYVSDFRGKTREVRLQGEAYFDVRSRPDQPFIIHTGDVKTTVLGTKFTIRTGQDKEGVEVKVREGKVRVEREEHVIAELLANQQVQYNERTQESTQEQIREGAGSFAWTSLDMRFDAVPFGELTERLERRYTVEISFENSDLMNCPVSGKFDGTETLEYVLGILCGTRNATYTVTKSDKILIKGEGCP